jgi:hypothetical protein
VMLGDTLGLLERQDFTANDAIFARNLGHAGEHLEELNGRIGPALALPCDEKEPAAKLPFGLMFNKNGGWAAGHDALRYLGFGDTECGTKLTFINSRSVGFATIFQ